MVNLSRKWKFLPWSHEIPPWGGIPHRLIPLLLRVLNHNYSCSTSFSVHVLQRLKLLITSKELFVHWLCTLLMYDLSTSIETVFQVLISGPTSCVRYRVSCLPFSGECFGPVLTSHFSLKSAEAINPEDKSLVASGSEKVTCKAQYSLFSTPTTKTTSDQDYQANQRRP